jgi:hypothetical protein
VKAGGVLQALTTSGVALVGTDSVRLDADSPTDDPNATSRYRNDAVAFVVQREVDPLFALQSDPDRINVAWVKVDDDNPAANDARNTVDTTSHDVLRIVQVEDGTFLNLHPGQGGDTVAQVPFNWITATNVGWRLKRDSDPPNGPGKKSLEEVIQVMDAGVNGDAVVYYFAPKAAEIEMNGIFQLPTPPGVRFFAANFDGSAVTNPTQISTDTYDAGLGGDDHAKNQVLAFVAPTTRGVGAGSVNGRYHMVLWVEDRSWSSGFLGGGALMSVRYNKAVPEAGDTSAQAVNGAEAFSPDVALATGWPAQADFAAGDVVSFPVGVGFDQGNVALYFTQFGEIYYNEFSEGSGSWWQDASGLPAPTLVSNEGFPGSPSAFTQALTGEQSDFFGASAFGNAIIQEFTGQVAGSPMTCRRYDSRARALFFYAKDDGGWDAENDGTGYHRLFCRIHD